MRAAVSLVAGAASLAVVVAYGLQLWRRPEDLALACAAFAATFLLVHYAALAVSAGGDDGVEGACSTKRLALVMALVLYGVACAEVVWDPAASREVAVAALASWCCAAVLLLVYLVVSSGCNNRSDRLENGAQMA